jgi:hypothetical protein
VLPVLIYADFKNFNCFWEAIRIELEQSDGEKDIGVFVDENLSFNKHIQNQVNKANSIMGLIRRTYTYFVRGS